MIPCPLHLLTGWECPFCGMQRAIVALYNGNLTEAFMLNPVAWCMMPYMLILVVCSLSDRVRKSRIGVWAMSNKTIFSALGIMAVWGIARNLI
ncbi:MAG: DUF2752 domain-containing protein [Bacteroidales bacterium]|nr:DUF2752 domain-containing protein [Bacteroidales bacterium]